MGGCQGSSSVSFPPLLQLMYVAMLVLGIVHTLAADSIRRGGSLKDGETLVSRSQAFELGFFSPGTSTKRYLGIWYKNIPVQTVVWIANRDQPILDKSGELTIDDKGNVMLLNGRGNPIPLASSPAAESPFAQLLDDGNLVLAAESNNNGTQQVFWQSFDNPTDTLLPGMRLELKGKQNRLLTSWQSRDNPSRGDLEFGVDRDGTKRLLVWRRGATYWASGPWNGQGFGRSLVGSPTFAQLHFFSNATVTYFSYTAPMVSRFVMGFNDNIQYRVWLENTQEWVLIWSQPSNSHCESSSSCGDNGLCNNNSQPTCKCLPGFVPDPTRQWERGDSSGGCLRRSELECRGGDGFLPLKRVRLPISLSSLLVLNDSKLGIAQCAALCQGNCSCSAYSSADKKGTGCSFWHGDLLGIQENYGDVQDLYLRLAASDLKSIAGQEIPAGRSKKLLRILVPVVVAVLILVACVSICSWRRSKINDQVEEATNMELLLLEIGPVEHEKYQRLSLLSFADVVTATSNFSNENKLGEGGFGPVYKGIFPDGQEIAVKRLSRRSTQGLEEFKTEILLIAKLQHRNLVRLLGCCVKGEERMLIYEYMPNKSLDFFLFDPARSVQLDWGKRWHIIEGIAQGLVYLHKHSRLTIIHRDLKASNILLDNEMNPKISDFGMARIFRTNDSEANTNRVVGTYGYMSPEYAMEGQFSVKSDVFSFGVLLLEIVSGKRNTATCHFPSSLNLLGHAWKLWNEGKEIELVDPSLGGSGPREKVSKCIHVALLCVQEAAAYRPTMSDILVMLSTENASLPAPKQIAFLFGRRMAENNSHLGLPAAGSINFMTISSVAGR